MSDSFIIMVVIFSIVLWSAVSWEAIKPTKNTNLRKMFGLLFAGSISTIVLLVSLFQNLPFQLSF